jgi:glycosyltransferase involved in cell wall biosynthesis
MGKESPNLLLRLFMYLESYKLKRLERKVFEQVDLGIAVSEADRIILQKLCPRGKFVVVDNGVDTQNFIPGSEMIEPNTLVWVGGFNHYPNKEGIYHFLDIIYPLIKNKIPKIRLYLVGSSVTKKLKEIAFLDSTIKILGFVDDPLPFIQKASAFIVPLLSGGGTRLKILEAMSAKKAIITTTIGCEGIDGTNNKHYIIADKPEQFAMATYRVLNNEDLRNRLGENARRLVSEKYDWKIINNNLNNIYRALFVNDY